MNDLPTARIDLRIRSLGQLFDAMDPSPFREKALDDKAARWLLDSVREHPKDAPLQVVVHLPESLRIAAHNLPDAIHHHFRFELAQARRELRWRMASGWRALAVGLPLITLFRWLLVGGADALHLDELLPALGQSFFYAVLGAVFVSIVALPIAWMSARAPGPLQRALENVHLYVGALPGVIVALALVAISIRVAMPLYQTVATMLVAYVLLFLPRAVVSVRASLAQVPVELQQAATALGRPPFIAAVGITLRLAFPGIAAGMALVAMGIVTELTATLMLSPIGTETLATQFWSRTGEFDHMGAAPFALAMVVLSIPLCIILHQQATRRP